MKLRINALFAALALLLTVACGSTGPAPFEPEELNHETAALDMEAAMSTLLGTVEKNAGLLSQGDVEEGGLQPGWADEGAQSATEFLNTYVMHPDQLVEQADPKVVVYKMSVDTFCAWGESDQGAECAAFLAEHELIVRVKKSGSTLEVTVDLDGAEAMVMTLSPSSLSTAVDLGTLGGLLDDVTLAGRIAATLSADAASVKAGFSISEKVTATWGDFTLSADVGSTQVQLFGADSRLMFESQLGAMAMSAPHQWLVDLMAAESCVMTPEMDEPECTKEETATVEGTLSLSTPATHATGEIEPETGTLEVALLNIASALTLKLDDTELVNLALEPFLLSVKPEGEAAMIATFGDGFKMALDLTLSPLQTTFAEIDGWADQLFTVALGGSTSFRADGEMTQVELLSGSLSVTSSATPDANISVEAGQCLVSVELEAEAAHPVLSAFQVSNCN